MKAINTLPAILTIAFALSFSFAVAQLTAPGIEWQNTIGGSLNDFLWCTQQTSDGGYILGGISMSGVSGDKTEASSGGYDYWVVKLNNSGSVEWQNTIGGSGDDGLYSIQQTTDGGYILGGYSYSGISGDKTEASLGTIDEWVVKLNSTGVIEWQNTIGGDSYDIAYSIQQTSDGGYILGGESSSGISGDKTEASLGNADNWVVKLNITGAIEWQNTIGGSGDDGMRIILQTSDGGYILGGYSSSGISGDKTEASLGGYDYWVVKINSTGVIEWQNTIGGSDDDYINAMQQTSDGGYILGGSSNSGISGDKTETSLGLNDYWVVKLNATGAIEWQNTIGGGGDDLLFGIQQTFDGGYILGGWSSSPISGDKTETSWGYDDYWVVKLESGGAIKWQKTVGGNNSDNLTCLQQTSEGGYLLGGGSVSPISGDKTEGSIGSNDYWMVKLYPDACNGFTVFADADSDTYGDLTNSYFAADCITPNGYVSNSTDCNDANASVHPNATEVCNGIDDNCDGLTDEGCGGTCVLATNLVTNNITGASAKLNWDAVAAAEGYKIRYKVSSSSEWTFKYSTGQSKTLNNLSPNTNYTWEIKTYCTINPGFSSDWSAKQKFTTGIQKSEARGNGIFFDVYPNPFSLSSIVSFSLTDDSQVQIQLFDVTGRKLQTVLNENLSAGNHEVTLNRDQLIAGIYFLQIKMNDLKGSGQAEVITKKVVID